MNGSDADMIYTSYQAYFVRLLSVCLCYFAFISTAKSELTQTEANSRVKDLISANNPSDSVKILMDVLDLSDKLNKDNIRSQLMDVVQRSDNNELVADVINELATSTDDTRELAKLIELSRNIPEEEGRKTVETVLQMEQAKAEANSTAQNEIQRKIIEYSRTGMSIGGDPYEEIQNLYRALMFLGTESQGPMYLEYITRLQELVDNLPEKDHAIKNLFYTTAAIYFTRKRDYQHAIENDKKLINQLDVMKTHLEKNGMQKNDLDYFYYISFRRMLRNFKGLNPEEVQQIYDKCLQLVGSNDRIKEEFGNGGLTNSYYFMAIGDYKSAVPELHKALENTSISRFRRQELLGLLAWALNETGNHKEELEVLREYTMMNAADMDKRREDTFREIELRNNINKIIAEENRAAEKYRDENKIMRKTSITLVYVLAVILIFVCQAYFRLKRKVKILESGNKKLRTNIEHIFDTGLPSGTRDLRYQRNKLKG